MTLVSNPIIWISDPKFWILKVSQSLLSTEKQIWSVIPFSTPLTIFQNLHSRTMPTLRVNITEDRGNLPCPTDQGEERSGRFRLMENGVLPSVFILDNLSLDDSSFRTFSAAPCLGRLEPNAPGGGGGDDILHPKFFRPKIWVFRSVERFVFSLGTFILFRIP